ncbi:ubiquitin carboxyl-terminal hydrolase 14-like [Centruroides sculpturatus]|uniref:ubiquitin carboxyl-terminal hydrolase 14-like n=1 Tax=Centruroides sculpturatus TaxID=218467 RepID=UPI000C6CCC45|nr:ubiquitin carboxyl-terminal hydrolase 14-like [Centruroides sculpturatus]
MSVYKVKVKWSKEVFPDLLVNADEELDVFKAQLFTLTGVPPGRQKIMLRGTTLKDDSWKKVKLKDGLTFLMMGTSEELPVEPTEKPLFVEDMTENELASAMELPTGLTNVGNTCYINATVQCLKVVPELIQALKSYQGTYSMLGNLTPSQSITAVMRDLYELMERSGATLSPLILIQVVHAAFPRFAERSEQGGWMQQNLCKGSLKCTESEDEQPTHNEENFLQLSCFISQDVKYMHTGLKSRMQEVITKHSMTLDRDAQYQKTCKISRLPAYLTIQFVRFFYKERESINAKILKDVKFTLNLDVFDLCTEKLQQKLIPMRLRFKEIEDKKIEEAQNLKISNDVSKSKTSPKEKIDYSFPDDPGSNNSGYYELIAVLTHRGRSSTSGHYVAWIRHRGGNGL